MTITQTLEQLAEGAQIGPTKFEHSDGRLFADVLGRRVAVDHDGDTIRLTSPARLPPESAVSDQDVADAVVAAQLELGGLSELTWRGGRLVAWQWISPSSDAVDIATAARETVRMCLFAERLVSGLAESADLHEQVAKLESEYSD